MKRLIFFTFLIAISFSMTAKAESYSINGSSRFGCADWDYYKKVITIAVQEGEEGFTNALLLGIAAGNCVLFKEGETVYLMETGFTAVKIRREGDITEYWTNLETIKQR